MQASVNTFIKEFRNLSYHQRDEEKFKTFVNIAFLFFRRPFNENGDKEFAGAWDQIHERDRPIYGRLFTIMIDAMENHQHDFLGGLFMALELGNVYKGQFFTPYRVCLMMAKCTIGNVREQVERQGYVTISEPCSGAGAMIIAMAECFLEQGLNPAKHMLVTAQDVDRLAAQMTYIQLSAFGIPAKVIWGNTLAVEEREVWWTPVIYFENWPEIIHTRNMIMKMKELLQLNPLTVPIEIPAESAEGKIRTIICHGPQEEDQKLIEEIKSTGAVQLSLFEGVA